MQNSSLYWLTTWHTTILLGWCKSGTNWFNHDFWASTEVPWVISSSRRPVFLGWYYWSTEAIFNKDVYVHTCAYYMLCLLIIIAAQMWLLGRVIPYLFGEDVPEGDENWNNYLQLLEIVDILMAPEISEDEVAELSLLIQQHHFVFKKLYTASCVLPKHHFMIHMPHFISKLVTFHGF